MNTVIISLGSNVGDWKETFTSALGQIQEFASLDRVSSVYETEPWGKLDQNWFKNQVVGLHCELGPNEILQQLLDIEKRHGRDRAQEEHWGPRTLDLDVLFYGNKHVENEQLDIPHPRLHQRRFILEPLVEIYPDIIHPMLQVNAQQMLASCEDSSQVKLVS